MRNLPLLFGCFEEFRGFVVSQAPFEDSKNFRRGFAGGANDENAVELLLVGAITCCKRGFDVIGCGADFSLFLARPFGGPGQSGSRRMRIANSWMTVESFETIF